MTANVITYRGRSAAREVGKALGFEVTSLEKLSSLAGAWEWKDPKETTERHFREAGFDLNHPRVSKFCERTSCVSTIGLAPLTVTVSARLPTRKSALTVAVVPAVRSRPSCLTVPKPVNVKVTVYAPGRNSTILYSP